MDSTQRQRCAADATTKTKTMALSSLALVWCLLCVASMVQIAESFQTTTTSLKPLPSNVNVHANVHGNTNTNTNANAHANTHTRLPQSRSSPLYLFGRNKKGDESNKSKTSIRESGSEDENGDKEKKRSRIPFFARLRRSKGGGKDKDNADSDQSKDQNQPVVTATTATATATTTAVTPVKASPLRPPKSKRNGSQNPADLILMAEKARLEAERMDAELTLSKIEKLEQQLLKSKNVDHKETANANANVNVEDLQLQLDALQAKLRGEPVAVAKVAPSEASSTSTSSSTSSSSSSSSSERSKSASVQLPVATKAVETPSTRTGALAEIDDAKVLEVAAVLAENEPEVFSNIRTTEDLDLAPDFLVRVIAPFYGLKPESNGKIDKAELLDRWNRAKNLDYGFFDERDPPNFDKSEIRKRKSDIIDNDKNQIRSNSNANANANFNSNPNQLQTISKWFEDAAPVTVTKKMMEKADGNATQLAIYSLEYDYYLLGGAEELVKGDLGAGLVTELFQNSTYFGSMYPKCVTARGEGKEDYVSEEPTEAQVNVLAQTILPAIKFSSSAKPVKVPGGYAITGSHKFEDGDKLIEAIDAEIAKSRPNLQEQMTVLYTPSYGPLNADLGKDMQALGSMDMSSLIGDPDVMELFAEQEPILYITGPTIVRDSNSIGLALASICGIATSWYLSVYPFLLNDQIAGRIDADLQLVEAQLQPDLSYMTDLSVPLFFTFMGLQMVHEFAHALTAWSKGVKLSVPVFVPSLITGITSTVTTFKTLPKNKNDMFDIAAAGPLAGVVVSSLALAIGAKLTLVSDPATLPALPLGILRQSTLGGAIIDNILQGALYLPEGASAAAITIPLHPFAIAGYVGLIVNALALLPIGTTDGGRLTMALFDRAEKMSIGTLTLSALLFAGLFGSDLFLFYFSFCLAFQTGNEVPARNEQDSVDFSRIFVALVCYGLAILTLVPIQ